MELLQSCTKPSIWYAIMGIYSSVCGKLIFKTLTKFSVTIYTCVNINLNIWLLFCPSLAILWQFFPLCGSFTWCHWQLLRLLSVQVDGKCKLQKNVQQSICNQTSLVDCLPKRLLVYLYLSDIITKYCSMIMGKWYVDSGLSGAQNLGPLKML